jgi:hypothetical protein
MTPQYIHIDKDGDKFYFKDMKMTMRHREDGPAVELTDGYEGWYFNDMCHREDGPAVVYPNGKKYWFLNGVEYSEEEHARRAAKTVELTLDQIAEKFGISVEKLKIVKN